MGKKTDSYEAWIEMTDGKWKALSDEDGAIKLFPSQDEARTEAVTYSDDKEAIRALIFRRILVEEINCAGRTSR